ncbi:MAG: DUF4238 domain-containing protein [Bacteroidetes bacterium]|nr:DUF4238 domain-containing protein [Bacteroidota bacterium]
MSNPIRQHLVPRVYLKQFALKERKDWFIDAYDTKNNKFVPSLNINNVCVNKEFYTFKKLPEENKRFLERFYGQTVESDYPEIYQALTNPKHIKISDNFRFKIISYIISQYWRTSKLTNTFNSFWNSTMEHAYNLMEEYSPERIIQSGNQLISFENRTFEDYKLDSDEQNREMINLNSYYRFKDLTLKRMNDSIMVSRMNSEHRLITSDNPVGTSKNIYDPLSWIRLPLDSRHIVSVVPCADIASTDMPNKPNVHVNKIITRVFLDKESSYFETTVFNYQQFGQCEKFVLGKKADIDKVLAQRSMLDEKKFQQECEQHVSRLQDGLRGLKKAYGIPES